MPDLTFDAIGTAWTITTDEPLSGQQRDDVADLVAGYDRTYSRFRRDSVIAPLAQEAGTVQLPPSAVPLLRLFDTLHRFTGGAVNPLVGHSLEKLGYDAAYSFSSSGPSAAPDWTLTAHWRQAEDGTQLSTTAPVTFDIGAAGKGQLVDLVFGLLRAAGHRNLTVDAGSDLRHAGERGLRVALEHPYDATRAIGVVPLRNRALCASAANRRAWGEGLHHIVDAGTGRPVEAVAATWVLAEDAMTADGLATALFFTDPDLLAEEFAFDYVRMFSDGRATYSDAMAGVLFS
ncbi:FAD:protein FMN transferase [Arthrobacter sp. zg-Y820]|uniref:FAD:protein FMN transferase n=1 Tax=unclassified Arthrobacter TaxID=235627 RepID=UPI001E484C11|nr:MULTISPECIES: FAD:protein FMN transferase [unclassified Arthrobacter]MCC9196077.1 FAD:protein FMN transferase [Arthrobacter sp. zg-Y820]MDK1278936.1 FAD:protein FMN transferase [Arthrobacter sp. zg.Y820]WIB08651.1 FAD:protein FMN transferase [Arthrobacter sp. zg-Y820]